MGSKFLAAIGAIWVLTWGCNTPSEAKHGVLEPEGYSSWTAEAKRNWIWNEAIEKTRHKNLPELQDIKIFQLIFASMSKKLENASDFSPRKWKKSIHRRAVVAQIRYVPEPSTRFSGVFKDGGIGILRASLTYTPEKRGVAPGIALKIFQNQAPSLDASFLPSLDSQGQNYNFFAKTFSNYVPKSKKLGAKFVALLFSRATRPTNMISLKHFVPNEGPAPRQVFLKAAEGIHFAESPARDFRGDFLTLSPGTVLLDVYARTDEKANDFDDFTSGKSTEYEAKSVRIGKIVLESNFVASAFGDDGLFFRHQPIHSEN